MRKYKNKRAPFNQKFNINNYETPITWWESAYTKEEWELQALALRLFAITPHSASCERSFSILGWFYGQRRAKLSVNKIEGMCKLHTYYITNAKKELPYYSIDLSEEELHNQLLKSINEIGNELEEDFTEEDFNLFDNEDIIDTDVNVSQIYDLNITKDIDIEIQIFNLERKEGENNEEEEISQRNQPIVLIEQREDFDIEALVAREISNIDEE